MSYAKRKALKRGNFLIILISVTTPDVLETKSTQLENWMWGGLLCNSAAAAAQCCAVANWCKASHWEGKAVGNVGLLPPVNICIDVHFGSIVRLEHSQLLYLCRPQNRCSLNNNRYYVVSPEAEIMLSQSVCREFLSPFKVPPDNDPGQCNLAGHGWPQSFLLVI